MAVPEAPINETYSVVFEKNDVRFSGQAFVMEFVSKPVPMKARADNHFRFCILSLDSGHHSGSGCLICNVHLAR